MLSQQINIETFKVRADCMLWLLESNAEMLLDFSSIALL